MLTDSLQGRVDALGANAYAGVSKIALATARTSGSRPSVIALAAPIPHDWHGA